jgi:hypothetical protein
VSIFSKPPPSNLASYFRTRQDRLVSQKPHKIGSAKLLILRTPDKPSRIFHKHLILDAQGGKWTECLPVRFEWLADGLLARRGRKFKSPPGTNRLVGRRSLPRLVRALKKSRIWVLVHIFLNLVRHHVVNPDVHEIVFCAYDQSWTVKSGDPIRPIFDGMQARHGPCLKVRIMHPQMTCEAFLRRAYAWFWFKILKVPYE